MATVTDIMDELRSTAKLWAAQQKAGSDMAVLSDNLSASLLDKLGRVKKMSAGDAADLTTAVTDGPWPKDVVVMLSDGIRDRMCGTAEDGEKRDAQDMQIELFLREKDRDTRGMPRVHTLFSIASGPVGDVAITSRTLRSPREPAATRPMEQLSVHASFREGMGDHRRRRHAHGCENRLCKVTAR